MRTKRMMGAGLLVVAAMSLQGCLDADKVSSISYDAKADAFTLLRVYYNIHGDQAADVQSLLSLYANRDHVLPVQPWSIFTEKGLMKIGQEWREVDLGSAKLDVAAITPPVDMAGVENNPGTFFTSPDGNVCYYHQVVISGATMDKLLEWSQVQVRTELAKDVGDENTKRTTGESKPTWAHEKKILVGEIQNLPADQREPQAQNEVLVLSALSDESLALLKGKGALTLSRKGGVFHAVGKVTPADAKELKDLLATLRAEVQNKIEGGKGAIKQEAIAAALIIDALDVKVADDGTVDIAADTATMGPLLAKLQVAGMKAPAEEKKADYARIVEGLNDAKAEVGEEMSAAEVVRKFGKGELKVNKSDKPVKVGEGLGEEGK